METTASTQYKASWTQINAQNSDIILPRSSHGVSCTGSTLIVFGGENVARTPIDSNVYYIDIAGDNTWKHAKAADGSPEPQPRVAHSQVFIGNSLYIFGGRQGILMEEKGLNDMWKFDFGTFTWSEIEQKGDIPETRSFHKCFSENG